MSGRIEVAKSRDDQWFYRVVAANGETLSTSETYTRREDAVRAAESVGTDAEIVTVDE